MDIVPLSHPQHSLAQQKIAEYQENLNYAQKNATISHKLKSLNQLYNKRVATIKLGKAQGFWNEELASLAERRNRQVRDAVNKAARVVINHCLQHRIGTVVFGWNQRNKDGIELGKKTNQELVCRAFLTGLSRVFLWNSKKMKRRDAA